MAHVSSRIYLLGGGEYLDPAKSLSVIFGFGVDNTALLDDSLYVVLVHKYYHPHSLPFFIT